MPENVIDASPAGRVVAIVGRPNVGKSAIFNRLVGRRTAIVHAQSGVTRDRLMREIDWKGEHFELVDTGGLADFGKAASRDVIEAGIREQAEAAIDDAAVVLLVTDVTAGLVPLDEEVADMLRGRKPRILVAANKADRPGQDDEAAEFSRLGFPVYPVSALQNRGFNELMTTVVHNLPPAPDRAGVVPVRVAVIGRPNVGKSSYINRLLRSERVLVSDVPGTTRDSIDVPFAIGKGPQARHYLLMDTAGIRREGKIRSSVEFYSLSRSRKSIAAADVVVLVVDATSGPTAQDRKIASAVLEARKGCIVLVNKWDLSEETQTQVGPKVRDAMPFMGHCPIVFASAQTGYNIRRSVDAIDLVASQVCSELPTGVLNRAVKDACRRVHPPSVDGKPIRIYYAVQVGRQPICIRLFANRARDIPQAYRRYLVRSLRERFGLEGAPVELDFKPRHAPSAR